MTFSEITSFLLGATRRPASFLAVTKLCVNLAQQEATKLINFNCLKVYQNYTFIANTELVDWQTAFPTANSIKGIFLVDANNKPVKRIRIFEYERLLDDELRQYDDCSIPGPLVPPYSNYYPYKAFLLGQNVGLYPTQNAAVNTKVLFSKKLATLTADADTNILLDNCSELIVNLALQKLNNYLTEDERFPVTKNAIDRSLAAAQQWDSDFASNHGIDWQ